MADGELEVGTGASEGELEDGEVLSSEEEEEEEEGEVKGPEGKGEGDDVISDSGRTATKRPAPESAHAASPKSPKLEPPAPPHTDNASDLEEGEIFSDDEESAYYPQLVKSRSTTKPDQGKESDSSESETGGERKRHSRGRGYQGSPERDSYQSRWRRSTERERDSDGSGLFFEDREGGRNDDSRDRKGDQSHHSSSKQDHRYSSSPSSKYSRERDRDRGDRDRRDKSDGYHRRDKDSYRSRDHDSNVDSSEEESSSSSWSRHHRTSRSYHSYQKGRRGQSYQQKYGQKYDKFGGVGGVSGRQGGEREGSQSSSWSPAPGRMNTGMTAQQFHALAEKVRKRRDNGLSLLPTPKIKPSDNLDQFNYPAPPSWYLEAVENWEKEQKQKEEEAGKEGQEETKVTTETATKASEADQIGSTDVGKSAILEQLPPPLFPVQNQPGIPIVGRDLAGVSVVSGAVGPDFPRVQGVSTPHSGGVGVSDEGGGGGGGGWVGIGEVKGGGVGGGEMTASVQPLKTVEVSSLALNMEGVDEEDELEGVGMKIALETPTPQPDMTKKFDIFQAALEKKAENRDAPAIMSANDVPGEGEGKVEMMEVEEQGASSEEKGGKMCPGEISPPTKPTLPPPVHPLDQTGETSAQPALPVAPSNTPPPTNVALATTTTSTAAPVPLMSLQPPEGSGLEEVSHLESENEEDFDYDEYLDQLNEEEEEVQPVARSTECSSELLQLNPLDEDFPAINPSKRSRGGGRGGGGIKASLKFLVAGEAWRDKEEEEEEKEKSTDFKTKGVKTKSVRRKQKQAEWWARQKRDEGKNKKEETVKPPCKYYLNGFCKHGDSCQYNHDIPRPKKKEVCRFYLQDHCNKGDSCLFYHGTFPCKFFHTKTYCKHGNSCKFSHDPLTDETRELLAQVLEPTKDPLKQIELSAMGIPETTPLAPPLAPPTALPTSDQFFQPQGGPHLQGAEPPVRVKFFSSDNPSNLSNPSVNFIPPPNPIQSNSSTDSKESLQESLIVSISNQLLERSLVISIPRQKLGPPFGTIPIPKLSLSPATSPSLPPSVPPSLPPSFVSAPQSSPSVNFVPPGLPPPRPFPTPPNQSAPIANFTIPPRNFLRPPGPNQPPIQSMPPQPNGWQPPAQPTPLFPPTVGTQEILPMAPNLGHIPPAHPHPPTGPQPPPQNHIPQSERKGLLPTPPSHMQLNPENIKWTEGDAPEYWEAPEVSQQPGPGGGGGRGRGKVYSHHSQQPVPRYGPQGQVDSNKHPPPVPPQFGSGPGHPQPPGPMFSGPHGPFGPPHLPPHAPQQAVGGPGPTFNPRNQPITSGVDPRQARLEPGLGGAMDPRRGIPPTNVAPVQPRPPMADPRHPVGTVPPPDTRVPAHPPGHAHPPGPANPPQPQPPHAFQPPGQRSWGLPQPSVQPPLPPQPGMSPPHPGHVPFQPTSSIPIPPSSGTTTGISGEVFVPVPPANAPHVPPGQIPGIGHFGTGMNPAPNQPPTASIHAAPPDMGLRPTPWGGNAGMSPEYSTSSSPVPGSITRQQRDSDHPATSDLRPLRVDPRTKYSHLKIKSKGSTGSNPPQGSPVGAAGGHSILKRGAQGEGVSGDLSAAEREAGGRISFSPMPKLLQNRDNLEKPLDPKELFGSAEGKEASDSAEFEVTGHFGSSIGSYFTRHSESTHLSKQPFGEITMPEVREKKEEGGIGERDVEAAAEASTKGEREEAGREGEETKVEVPSYLAELGVGLGESDLMIDSAFSSLDKKDGGSESETQKQKPQDAAKKLPNIFGFTL